MAIKKTSKRKPPAASAEPVAPLEPPRFQDGPKLDRVVIPGGRTWQSIPQYPRAAWEVDVHWHEVVRSLNLLDFYRNLDLDPDFQRGHVWTDEQRRAWVEYVLQGGETGRNVTFVTDDWRSGEEATFIAILDGKQRLETVQRFLRGEVRIFADAVKPEGYAVNEIGGVFRGLLYTLKFRVIEVPNRAAALTLYLQFNGGGTPHSEAELLRVRALLDAERAAHANEALLAEEADAERLLTGAGR